MSIDLRRSHSRTSDLRPRVSFNRDVHVKRYGNKSLPKIEERNETETEMKSRGRADGTDYTRRGSISDEKKPPTSIAKRIKQFFVRKPPEDAVRTRYKEYKGEDYDRERRRDSAPDAKGSWFRSLERPKKVEKDDTDTSNRSRNLRYFGESDAEHSTRSRYLSVNRRRYAADSTDDATDAEPGRYDSLVYLHAAQVRDIPSPRHKARGEETLKTRKRHLTRSVSLVGPWTPSHRPVSRSGAGLKDTGTQTISRIPKGEKQQPERHKLPTLVFTGPSIEGRTSKEWRGRV